MKILIVDDEAPARAHLHRLVEEIGAPAEVVGEAADGKEALAFCARNEVDVLLLDIRMPGKDGLAVAAKLAEGEAPPAVIFTTAYDEHALQAFDRDAIDYLLKPVRRKRLEKALARVAVLTRPQLQALEKLREDEGPEYIAVSYRGGLQRIAVEDIHFFRAEQKYVVARHREGEALLEESLKSLEERFGGRFLRIHRNALVARERVTGLVKEPDGRCLITLADSEDRLEVSRRHLPEVRRFLKTRG
jgi:two-component system response regulator AlgR